MEITSHIDQGVMEAKFLLVLETKKKNRQKYVRFWFGVTFVASLLLVLYLYTPLMRIIQ
jgi:hypothetical protein